MTYKSLLERQLIEILDFKNIREFTFEQVDQFNYKFDAGNFLVKVEFTKTTLNFEYFETVPALKRLENTETFNAGYSVNDVDSQYERSNLETLLPILKTISAVVNDFIQKNKPISVLVFPTDRFGNIAGDSTKAKIYQLMIRKFIPSGYGFNKIKLDGDEGSIIYNINYSKRKKM